MIMTNIESVPGKKITSLLGMVSGSTVRAKHAGKDICASFKNFFGGEIKGYTELMEESRKEATQRMVQQATKLGQTLLSIFDMPHQQLQQEQQRYMHMVPQ